jgi:hypothetical protein
MIVRGALLVAIATTLGATLAAVTARAESAKPTAARASEPDPAVQDAADANLETTESRSGLTFTVALGGGLTAGFGITDSVGRGGALSLRLGHVATRHTVITFELTGTASLHKAATMSSTEANTDVNLLAGAQYYINPSLWVRAAGGVGVYTRRDVRDAGGNRDITLVGPTALGGLGFELLRFKSAVLGLELNGSAMVSRDGLLIATVAGLDLAFD